MNYNGGYFIIGKTDKDLVLKLIEALEAGKPVLWYENDKTCYYIDTLSAIQTEPDKINFTLTKGGLTITVDSDGVVTETGSIQPSGGSNVLYIDTTDEDNYSNYSNSILTQDVFDELIDAIQNHKIIVFAESTGNAFFELVTYITMNQNGLTNGYNLYTDMYGGQFYDYQLDLDTRKLQANRP